MDRIIFRNRNLSKSVLAVIVVVIVVIAGASLVYYNSKKPQTSTSTTTSTQSISTTTSTSTFTTTSTTTLQSLQPLIPESYSALAGQPLEVSIPNFKPGYYALVYDGSGKIINVTNQYFNLTFNYPGSYLVYYNIYSQGNLIGSSSNNLIEIVVTPYISFNESNYITVPVIAINKGPVIAINQPFNLSLGFLQPPSGNNITIKEYIISFGNGTKITLPARNSTGYAEQVFLTGSGNISYIEPVKNPITVSFNTPGLYPISLTIVTENISSGKTYNYTVYHTVAVSSENMQFNLYSIQSSIPNPGVIVDAEVVPGGPFTFDPSLFPDTVSNEIINNIYGSLVWYYQSSTTQFIPMLAEYIPTVGNWSNVTNRYKYGAISPNYTIYIFKIRPGLKASNGDPITAYDVWYTMIRMLVCAGGVPSGSGTNLAPFTVPNYTMFSFIVTSPNDSLGAKEIINSVSYNNQTNTITFNLIQSVSPEFFFNMMTTFDYVMDAKWLNQVNDGLNLTGLYDGNYTQLAQSFYQYQQTCIVGNYNTQVQWPSSNAGFTGPYFIASYTPGQSVVLKPNPYWPNNITYFPRPNDTVIVDWVKDPTTALNMLASGEADIVTFPKSSFSPYIPTLQQLESQGKIKIYSEPSLNEWWFSFNLNISETLLKEINPSYNIPSYYFANPLVREAFAYAFNYTEYINDILGNAKYHMNLGQPWCGILLQGMDYPVPPSELNNCPTFNLTYAKQLMEESGFYNISVNFPIIVSSGDTVDFTAAEMWAQNLHEMDPYITAIPLYMPFSTIISYMVPGANPMPVYYLDWNGIPLAWYWLPFMYQEGGVYGGPDGWNVTYLEQLSSQFNSTGNKYVGALIWQESQQFKQLNDMINEADLADEQGWANATSIIRETQQQAIDLYIMVYVVVPSKAWILGSYMNSFQNSMTWQSNPSFTNGLESEFWWWEKP
ncbi:MAG: ABC transporter substrate-binding protein [Caldisphaera sp.]